MVNFTISTSLKHLPALSGFFNIPYEKQKERFHLYAAGKANLWVSSLLTYSIMFAVSFGSRLLRMQSTNG
jgi:hypothetical protein